MDNKQNLKNSKTSAEVVQLYTYINHHIQALPKQSIYQTTILVSCTNEGKLLAQKLINQKLQDNPKLLSVNKQPNIVYSSDSFLNPKVKNNFFTMHYLLKTVKKVKFLFVVGHNDADDLSKMRNVKNAFVRLFAFFKKKIEDNQKIAQQLSTCCGIIINDAQKAANKYLSVIKQMAAQQKYLDQDTRNFVRYLTNKNDCIMTIGNKSLNQQQLSRLKNFVGKLKYFKLNDFFGQRLNDKLEYEYQGYANCRLAQGWPNILEFIIKKLDVFLQQYVENGPAQNRVSIHKQIKQKIEQFKISRDNDIELMSSNRKKSTSIITFIIEYISLIEVNIKKMQDSAQKQKQILLNFISILEQCYFLKSTIVKCFFQIYYDIYRCLHFTQIDKDNKDLFQTVEWKKIFTGNKEAFNQKIRIFIITLFKVLNQQLQQSQQQYPFDEIKLQLDELLKTFDSIKQSNDYNFLTIRTFKKIKKFKAQFAFRKATFLSKQIQKQHETMQAWLQFLDASLETTLVKPKQIEQAITNIASFLTEQKEFKLTLKLYRSISQQTFYRQIRDIYQKGMQFYPQILKYTLLDNWYQQEQNFISYCHFLLRMGKNQQVRQLCHEVIGVLRRLDIPDAMQEINRLLLHTRSENSREQFNKLLSSLMQQAQIKLEAKLLKEIRDKIRQFE